MSSGSEIARRDWKAIVIIGVAVGLLVQPVLANVVERPLTALLRTVVFLGLVILAPLALLVASYIGRVVPVLYQFAKFAAVGTLNSMVDLGVLNLEILFTNITVGFGFTVLKTISFLVATTNSFLWNKYWTFEARTPVKGAETVKFYVVAIIGGIINIGVASLLVRVGAPGAVTLKQWANVAAVLGIFSALIWDFLGYKYFVFKKPEAGPAA